MRIWNIDNISKLRKDEVLGKTVSIKIEIVLILHFLCQLSRSVLILIDFSLTVKAATLIFISGRGMSISSAKEGKSGFIHNLIRS